MMRTITRGGTTRALAMLGLLGAGLLPVAWAVEPGQALPMTSLPGPSAAPVLLHDGKAKLTYIDFWASWCGPCRKSMPWMNQMQQKFGPQGLRIVAINLDSQATDAQQFLQQVPANVQLAFDASGESARRFGVKTMPTSVLVNADGKVIEVHQGFRAQDPALLEARIAALLAPR